jgi:hypothetical protein
MISQAFSRMDIVTLTGLCSLGAAFVLSLFQLGRSLIRRR